MADTAPTYTVHNNEARQRFETTLEGHSNVLEYRQEGQVLRLVHTLVHPSLEGRGIASALVRSALDHARTHNLKVDPQCEYARAYMDRHADTQVLRA